ncbi:N-acetyl-gamma-glutamyl-phosphate reductase [Persicobacter psychrovividus]|uniref:N-acetyl-gamma-glutamyl-phosphate reductase n=1 Tax=Persicobacter psychrovividus TaxID=387638 RepID=A0ABM7VKT1_9BACT|nr:N-acetyl-gamma-glutamyl-phosphate reductase [Persicobacter psychrovividus]
MIKVGIIGGAGYTAGELLRLLVNHPKVQISFVQSTSQAGKAVTSIHHDLVGSTNMEFVAEMPKGADVIFLCMGHGKSREFMEKTLVDSTTKVIDLSHDFRLKDKSIASDHRVFIYGLPELNKNAIKGANHIANPGCFATAIQLALLPAADIIQDDVHIHAITGATGAGQNPTATTHFSWRNNNVSHYKAFEHQHLGEIGESMVQAGKGFDHTINFLPIRGDFARGIFATAYFKSDLTAEEVKSKYQKFYKDAAFTHVVDHKVSLKEVVNTNKCVLNIEKIDGKILITSCIDNLLKGASGQAVQNMNLMFGLPEHTGIQLKSIAF